MQDVRQLVPCSVYGSKTTCLGGRTPQAEGRAQHRALADSLGPFTPISFYAESSFELMNDKEWAGAPYSAEIATPRSDGRAQSPVNHFPEGENAQGGFDFLLASTSSFFSTTARTRVSTDRVLSSSFWISPSFVTRSDSVSSSTFSCSVAVD